MRGLVRFHPVSGMDQSPNAAKASSLADTSMDKMADKRGGLPMKIGFLYSKPDHFISEYVPVSFGYLISYLKKHNSHPLEFVVSDRVDELVAQHIDLLGVSSVTGSFNKAILDTETFKKASRAPAILGGSHISGLPESLPHVFDVGVIGEGERTLSELVSMWAVRGGFRLSDLEKIPGIVYRNTDKKLQITRPRGFIRNMNELPVPDRGYYNKFNAEPYLISTRGCPYRCVFCLSSKTWGYQYRHFSPGYVVDEIKRLILEFPDSVKKEIYFADDLFVSNKKRLSDFITCLEKENMLGIYRFGGNVRANLVDHELCGLLKQANFYRVNFGLESGSKKILHMLKAGTLTPAQNQRALDLLHAHGIFVKNSFITGIPEEAEEDLHATYGFIIRNMRERKILEASGNTLIPFPGTAVWKTAFQKGLVKNRMNWDRISKYTWYRGDLIQGHCGSFDDWVRLRKENGTIYLGGIEESRFYDIVQGYEEEIDCLKRSDRYSTGLSVCGFRAIQGRPEAGCQQ